MDRDLDLLGYGLMEVGRRCAGKLAEMGRGDLEGRLLGGRVGGRGVGVDGGFEGLGLGRDAGRICGLEEGEKVGEMGIWEKRKECVTEDRELRHG